ncbi:MAG TPA: hypothetical protein DEB39_06980 [Planctomycetaceae bacterium]|nr:hypothetical protein [Planctomycetaceae bacterium]
MCLALLPMLRMVAHESTLISGDREAGSRPAVRHGYGFGGKTVLRRNGRAGGLPFFFKFKESRRIC